MSTSLLVSTGVSCYPVPMVNSIWFADDKFLKFYSCSHKKMCKAIAFLCLWVYFDFCMLQQDSAPAHRACEMVEFQARETPGFSPMLLSDDTMDIFSSVNQIIFTVEAG